MRLPIALAIVLLACSIHAQAVDKQPPAATPCTTAANAGAPTTPCQAAPMPVFTVSIQADAPPAKMEAAPVDEKPFVSLFDRSLAMRLIAWYCAAMFPIALISLTIWSVVEVWQRRRKEDIS